METKKQSITIIGQIYETYNYDMFSFFEENRGINPANVERLVKSMKVKRNINPIIVDSSFRIVDGQHRYYASKELGLSIQYILDKDATIDDIPRLNTVTRTWKQVEYLDYYRKRGYKAYKTMYEFMLQHNFGTKEAIYLLSGLDDGKGAEKFKNGTMQINDYKKSSVYAIKWNKIKEVNSKVGIRFFKVIVSLIRNKDFNLDEFLHKLYLQPTKLVPCLTSKQTRALIEEIYNYNRRNKVNLRI